MLSFGSDPSVSLITCIPHTPYCIPICDSAPPDILADVAAAVELRTELLAAGHTPSAEFSSRLATMMERHGHSTSEGLYIIKCLATMCMVIKWAELVAVK